MQDTPPDIIITNFSIVTVNFTGITQILSSVTTGSVKHDVDQAIRQGKLERDYVRTVSVGEGSTAGYWNSSALSEEERNKQIMNAIKLLLGNTEEDDSYP